MLDTAQIEKVKQRIARLEPTLGGKFLFHCVPFRKQVVFNNMRIVFGNALSEPELQKLALCFYSHLFTSLRENIQLRFMSQEQIKKRAIVIGEDNLADLSQQNIKGALVITGHFGNWEFAPIAGILNFTRFKQHFYFVRKTQSIQFLEKLLFKRYYDVGLGVIPKKNSLMQMSEVLEKNQIIIFVMDQNAKKKEGIPVEFFGKKVGTHRSIAMISRQTGAPVIPARSYRQEDGRHVLEFFAPLPWIAHDNPTEEVYLNTRQYNQTLEKLILEYPEQWLWMYKRWKD